MKTKRLALVVVFALVTAMLVFNTVGICAAACASPLSVSVANEPVPTDGAAPPNSQGTGGAPGLSTFVLLIGGGVIALALVAAAYALLHKAPQKAVRRSTRYGRR